MKSTELKNRAQELAGKTNSGTISPTEVGGIMYDTVEYIEDVERNGAALGIRKTYTTVSAMEADSNPTDSEGNPLKKGMLVNIYNQEDPLASDNGKVFSWQNPGWQLRSKIDAGYATREELTELEGKTSGNLSYMNLNEISNVSNIPDVVAVLKQIPNDKRHKFATIKYRDSVSNIYIKSYKSQELDDDSWSNMSYWDDVITGRLLNPILTEKALSGIYTNRDDVKISGVYKHANNPYLLEVMVIGDVVYQTEFGGRYNAEGFLCRSRSYKNGIWGNWINYDVSVLPDLQQNILDIISRLEKIETIPSSNLLDISKATTGYVSTSKGTISVSDTYPNALVSDYINVVAGKTYYIQGRGNTGGIVGYDNDGNKLYPVVGKPSYYGTDTPNQQFTIAEGVVKIRLTITLDGSYGDVMLSEGDNEKPYTPYKALSIADVVKELYQSSQSKPVNHPKAVLVKKDSSNISVYSNICDANYIEFCVQHTISTTDNVDYWRLVDSYYCVHDGKNFSRQKQVLTYNENEYVLHLNGGIDSTGGYHGDEKVDDIFFLIDGVKYSIDELSNIQANNSIEYCESSIMYGNAIGDNTAIANHYKITKFMNGGYYTRNRTKFLKSLTLDSMYGGLVSMHKNVGKQWTAPDLSIRTAVGNNEQLILPVNTEHPWVKYWNNDYGLSAEVHSKINYGIPNNLFKLIVWDRTNDTKYYHRLQGDTYNVTSDTDYETECSVVYKVVE